MNVLLDIIRYRLVFRYCPLVTPFKADTEEVDHEALKRQVVRLAGARMGIVLLGTNGEGNQSTCRHGRHPLKIAILSFALIGR